MKKNDKIYLVLFGYTYLELISPAFLKRSDAEKFVKGHASIFGENAWKDRTIVGKSGDITKVGDILVRAENTPKKPTYIYRITWVKVF